MCIKILKPEEIKPDNQFLEAFYLSNSTNEILFAFNNEKLIGTLKGNFINERTFTIIEIQILEKALTEKIFAEFAIHLFFKFKPLNIEIISWDKAEKNLLNYYLEKAGFKIYKKKVYVEKKLKNYFIPYEIPFEFKSLNEVGEKFFIEKMFEASIGDPFENKENDPEEDFQELVDYAGDKFNPEWWKIAYLNNIPAGVVLPQVFPYSNNEGTLFYMGIMPIFRGKGLGKIIHAFGLDFLSKNNILKYKGSTDINNAPMIKIFTLNECVTTNIQLIFST